MNNKVQILKTTNFDSVINEDKVTLVDFYATWCGPCKMLLPILDTVAESVGDKYNICKLDVDQSSEIASRYGIMSVPTMIVFKGGELKEKIMGLRQKDQIIAVLEKH